MAAGGDGNDVIYGNAGKDSIDGDRGNDRIYGGRGDDDLYSEYRRPRDSDYMSGGLGNDYFWAGVGAQTVRMGPGDDYLYLYGDGIPDDVNCGRGTDTVQIQGGLAAGGPEPEDTLARCEDVVLSAE